MSHKLGIIGAGDIGFNTAEILAVKGYDVVIYNRYHEVEGKPSPYWNAKLGKVMDITDGLQIPSAGNLSLTSSINDLKDCSAVIITAGAKRSHVDETREELAEKNAIIMDGFVDFFASNNILIMVITNPVDSLAQFFIERLALKTGKIYEEVAKRVIGISYVDTMRLKNIIKDELYKKSFKENANIEGFVIGEHGPTMVPLISSVKINGKNMADLFSLAEIENITHNTIIRGNDIIKLTGASSVAGPSFASIYCAQAILNNKEVTIPCSVWDGTRCIGKLAKFKDGFFSSIYNCELDEKERLSLKLSEAALDKQYYSIMKKMGLR